MNMVLILLVFFWLILGCIWADTVAQDRPVARSLVVGAFWGVYADGAITKDDGLCGVCEIVTGVYDYPLRPAWLENVKFSLQGLRLVQSRAGRLVDTMYQFAARTPPPGRLQARILVLSMT